MAGFTERIRLVFDVDNKGALSGFSGFKKAVSEAHGVTGKFSAGLGSLKQGFSQFMTSGTGMATVATAVGAGLIKAVTATQELALEVGKLSDATGLSTEEASRWVEVAGDIGIESEKIAGLIGKLTATLGASPAKFKAYGIEVQHAADGSVDMNATLLTAIDVLNREQDATKRAALAKQLFGKSWADASELVGMGADKLRKSLGAVSDAKVMTPEQIRQAREFRDAMDKLTDLGEDFMITVGKELVPVLTDLAKVLGTVGDVAGAVDDGLSSITGGAISLGDVLATVVTGGIYPLAKGLDALNNSLRDGRGWTEGAENATAALKAIIDETTAAYGDYANALSAYYHEIDPAVDAERRIAEQAEIAARAHRTLAEKMRDVERAWQSMTGVLSDENALADAVLAVSGLADELDRIANDPSLTPEERWAKQTLALNGMKSTVNDTVRELGFLDTALAEKIQIMIEQGDIDGALAKLKQLAGIAAAMKGDWFGSNKGRSSTTPGAVRGFASGTRSAPAGLALVGENGPELVNLRGGESILPAGQTAAALGGGTNVTINVSVAPGANLAEAGRQTADALAAFYRNGGQRP